MAAHSQEDSFTMIIHQYHPWLSEGDAITHQMAWIQYCLRKADVDGLLLGTHLRGDVPGEIQTVSKGRQIPEGDRLIIHHSQYNPLLEELLEFKGQKTLVYHNITPGKFFPHDEALREASEKGREQLTLFKNRVDQCFADSQYNGEELSEIGLGDAKVLPLFELTAQVARPSTKNSNGPWNLLFVGRLAPHKNQALLIEVLYWLSRFAPGRFSLTLVGGGDPVYRQYLVDLAEHLGVSASVKITGRVSEDDLHDAYSGADLFVSPSLHEGFGIPLIEAMVAGLPVFALAEAAVPETLGKSGVLINTRSPFEIAKLIRVAITDHEGIEKVCLSQERRVAQLSKTQNEGTLLRMLQGRTSPPRRKKTQRRKSENARPSANA